MIEILDVGAGNIIGCKIDGKIDNDDILKISRLVDDKIQIYTKLRVYVELINLEGISFEALMNDLKLAVKHYSKFERKAVVTDKNWIHTISPIAGRLFPGIEVKCFSFADRDSAVEWIRC